MFVNMYRRVRSVLLGAAFGVLPCSAVMADREVNLTPGVTEISRDIYDLHMLIFWICVIIAVLVFGVIIFSIVRHRKSQGAVAAQFHESTKAEIIWTIIPFLILVAMAIPSAKSLIQLEDTRNPDMSIKVTAYQWKWHYEYLDAGISFFSNLAKDSAEAAVLDSGIDPFSVDHYLRNVDNPLVVPVGKKVRLLITAADVIHSWWVPELAIKKDAIPGFVNEMWFKVEEPGVYRGQCAELCGRGHGYMPIVVVAKAEVEYMAWVSTQQDKTEAAATEAAAAVDKTWTRDELTARGEEAYNTVCAVCHQTNGQGLPPTFPALTGSAVVTGDISQHIDVVLNGRSGTAMLGVANQLSDLDIAAVITFERNSWGNDTGDIVQPADVQAAR